MNRCFTGAIAIAFMVAMAQPSIAQSGNGVRFLVDLNLGLGIPNNTDKTLEQFGIKYDRHFMGVANLGAVFIDSLRMGFWVSVGGGEAKIPDPDRPPFVKNFDWSVTGLGGFIGGQYALTENLKLYGDFGAGDLHLRREVFTRAGMMEGGNREAGFLIRLGANYELWSSEDRVRPILGLYAGGILSAEKNEIPHAFIAGITIGINFIPAGLLRAGYPSSSRSTSP